MNYELENKKCLVNYVYDNSSNTDVIKLIDFFNSIINLDKLELDKVATQEITSVRTDIMPEFIKILVYASQNYKDLFDNLENFRTQFNIFNLDVKSILKNRFDENQIFCMEFHLKNSEITLIIDTSIHYNFHYPKFYKFDNNFVIPSFVDRLIISNSSIENLKCNVGLKALEIDNSVLTSLMTSETVTFFNINRAQINEVILDHEISYFSIYKIKSLNEITVHSGEFFNFEECYDLETITFSDNCEIVKINNCPKFKTLKVNGSIDHIALIGINIRGNFEVESNINELHLIECQFDKLTINSNKVVIHKCSYSELILGGNVSEIESKENTLILQKKHSSYISTVKNFLKRIFSF